VSTKTVCGEKKIGPILKGEWEGGSNVSHVWGSWKKNNLRFNWCGLTRWHAEKKD